MCTGKPKEAWDNLVDDTTSSLSDAADNTGSSLIDAGENLADSANDVAADYIKLPTGAQGGSLLPMFDDIGGSTGSGSGSGTGSGSDGVSSAEFENPDVEESAIRRRRAVSRLRRGMYSTLKTSASGLLYKPSIDVPTLYGGMKSKLGM